MQSKSNIAKIIISLPICMGLVLFISSNILNTTVKNDYIKVYGLYGNKIDIADIEELSLEEKIPTINKVVNGIMLGNGKKKGYFELDDKNVRLYLYNSEGPYIYIQTAKDEYYLNLPTVEKTKSLYDEIMEEKSWK